MFKKNNSLGQLAKSRGVSIPKTARPNLASIKEDKSGESKIKSKHVLDKVAVSRVSTKYFYCGMTDTLHTSSSGLIAT